MNNLRLLAFLIPATLLAQNVSHTYEMKTADESRAGQIRQLVQDLVGGRAQLDWFPMLHTIVIKGSADAVDNTEALLKKFDVPPRQVEFTSYIIRAFKTKPPASVAFLNDNLVAKTVPASGEPAPLPAVLSPAAEEIKRTFGYQWLELIDTAVTRTSARAEFESGLEATGATYSIHFDGVSVSADGKVVSVPEFAFRIRRGPAIPRAGRGGAVTVEDTVSSIENEVTIHGDERLVLGKLQLPSNRGDIFVVLTAKPL